MEIEENIGKEDSSDSGRFSRSSADDLKPPAEMSDDNSSYSDCPDSENSDTSDEKKDLKKKSKKGQKKKIGKKKYRKNRKSSIEEQLPSEVKLDAVKTEILDEENEIQGDNKENRSEDKEIKVKEKTDESNEEEKYHKRLMHLLNKSKFFTSFLLEKLEISGLNQDKKKQNRTKSGSSSVTEKYPSTPNSDRNILAENVQNQRFKRSMTDDATTRDNPPKKKKKVDYAISDILTKEDVEKAHRQHIDKELMEPETNEPDVDNTKPEETKTTSMGFTVPKSQPNLLEGGVLRDYQLEGLEWLKVLFENGVSGILADEMGLGKTIQVISLICYLIEIGVTGPFLIVAPLSTLSNWLHEFEMFAPQIPVVLFYGNTEERMKLRKKLNAPTRINEEIPSVLPVVITSYQIPLKEGVSLGEINWQYIIVDEGHRIKNKDTLLNRVLTSFSSQNRLLLTGTPLQNNLTELWTLLNFLLPDMFHDLTTFYKWFDLHNAGKEAEKILQKEREEQLISTLHQILFPFVLRRTKSDILVDLPAKKEVVVYCPMTAVQLELYEFVVTRSLEDIPGFVYDNLPPKRAPQSSSPSVTPRKPLRNIFFNLRDLPKCKEFTERLCNLGCGVEFTERVKMQRSIDSLSQIVDHPYLVRMPVTYTNHNKNLFINEDLIKVSGKFLVLEAMLTKLKQTGHKVLIFSTSCMLLDLLEEFMIIKSHTYVRLDGSSPLMDRKNNIESFNTDPNIFVFLISTKAGGLGINLTAADTVILFNSDWNPMIDLQAQDRAHRIGQTKPVVVYRLTVAGTVDEKIVQCANSKKLMEQIVMKSGAFNLKRAPVLELQELAKLLKGRKESPSVHANPCGFTEEELEKLLDRSDLLEKDGKNECTSQTSNKVVISSQKSPGLNKEKNSPVLKVVLERITT